MSEPAAKPPQPAEPPAGPPPATPAAPERVLVVDDEPSVADVCSEYLGGEGFEVTVATSGEEALQVLPGLRPDVILTDINLPGLSGLEVVRHAKQIDPEACVIVVTGYASTVSAVEALRHGAYEYVTKPFDLEAVHKIVKSGIRNRRLKLQNRQMLTELQEKNAQLSRHEQELRERVAVATTQLRTLYEVNQEISASLELVTRLGVIARLAAETSGASAAIVYLNRERTEEFRATAAHGVGLLRDTGDAPHMVRGEGWIGACAASGLPGTWHRGDGAAPELPGVEPCEAACAVVHPLEAEGQVVGVVVTLDRPGGFSPEDVNYLSLFSSQAAIAIRNSQLFEHTKSLDRLKSEFVAVVSHEIRTPLTSIKGAIELLSDDHYFQNGEQQMKLLTIAHANTERLLVLIGDILDFSKLESASLPMHLESQRIEGVVQQAVHNVRTLTEEKRLQIDLKLGHDLPELMMDTGRVGQVLTNLLSNAIKFSPVGGRVEVSAERQDGAVRVAVRDQGEGIAPQNLSRLFQKFSQVDSSATRRAGGTGLGLVICKGIVEQHGGTIHVESTPGVGSTFYFLLPAAETPSRDAARAPNAA